jgi:hypothetical protein
MANPAVGVALEVEGLRKLNPQLRALPDSRTRP